MAELLDVLQLRQHIETDLDDRALERIIDSEEAEIVNRYGPHATASEMFMGWKKFIFLSRRASTITTVTELNGDTVTTLTNSDYRLWADGLYLERLPSGTLWGGVVTVEYVPLGQVAQRTLVLVQLCKLAIAYSGVKNEAIGQGDYNVTHLDYYKEREMLLGSLKPRRVTFA